MATVALPSSPDFKYIKPRYRRATTMNMSPYNYNQQVYVWAGKLKEVDFELPPMKETEAQEWIAFFNSLNGFENTFNVDLSRAYPNETGITSVEMRLSDPEQIWDLNTNLTYGITFSAREAK